jgi:hypothetical protein
MKAGVTRRARRLKAIAALLQARDVRQAAKMAGIGERTLYQWMRDDEFKAELASAEGAILDAVTRRMTALGNNALDVVEETLTTPQVSLTLRLQAAKMVFEYLLRMRGLRGLEERLNRLEALYGESAD